MSRTYKREGYRQFRHPKGHVRAVVNGERNIPPTAWEDNHAESQAWLGWTLAYRMVRDGKPESKIRAMLDKRGYSAREIDRMIDCARKLEVA